MIKELIGYHLVFKLKVVLKFRIRTKSKLNSFLFVHLVDLINSALNAAALVLKIKLIKI